MGDSGRAWWTGWAAPVGFLAWIASWVGGPLVVVAAGGSTTLAVAVGMALAFGPMVAWLAVRGGRSDGKATRSPRPFYAIAVLFFLLFVAFLPGGSIHGTGDLWIVWLCVGALFLAVGLANRSASRRTKHPR